MITTYKIIQMVRAQWFPCLSCYPNLPRVYTENWEDVYSIVENFGEKLTAFHAECHNAKLLTGTCD